MRYAFLAVSVTAAVAASSCATTTREVTSEEVAPGPLVYGMPVGSTASGPGMLRITGGTAIGGVGMAHAPGPPTVAAAMAAKETEQIAALPAEPMEMAEPVEAAALPPPQEIGAFEASSCVIYFELDSVAIRSDQSPAVKRCAKYFTDNPTAQLRLEGHSDERGASDYNLKLSERRAQAVQQALAQESVEADRIQISSHGEEQPAVQGHDEEAWRSNRRVQMETEPGAAPH